MKKLFKEIHQNAVDHGWWENKPAISITLDETLSKLALVHAEVSEGVEEVRKGKDFYGYRVENGKPEGLVVELADAVIRIADLCEALELDLEQAIIQKHMFNKTRPYKHGKKI